MRFKRSTAIVFMICIWARPLDAGVQSFTLAEVQRYTLQHNRDVRKSTLGIEAANRQLWEVTAQGFPQVNLTAQYQHFMDIPTQLIPAEIFGGEPGTTIPVKFGKPHLASYGLSVSQLIFSGSYIVGLQASEVFLQLSAQNLKRTELAVKATVTKTYYIILIAEETRKIILQSLENLRQTRFEINELNKEGFNEVSDVKQIQISVNELENGLRTIEQQIDISYKMLKYQMGIAPVDSIRLAEDLDEILKGLDIGTPLELQFDVEANIGYKAVTTQTELARLSLRNEKSTFLPNFSAFVTLRREAQRDKFDIFDQNKTWYPTSIVGVRMDWPIFSGSSKIFRIQKSRVELDMARTEQENVREGLNLQYRQAHSALSTARDRFQNARSNRDLAKEVYELNLTKYREGLISSLELTQAHNQYLNAEQNYLQNLSDALNAYTELKKVLEIL